MDQCYFLAPVASALPLAAARAVLDAALAAGRAEGLLPLTVVVLDAGAQIVASAREDGCGTLRFAIARGKAEGALGMGIDAPSATACASGWRSRPASRQRAKGASFPCPAAC